MLDGCRFLNCVYDLLKYRSGVYPFSQIKTYDIMSFMSDTVNKITSLLLERFKPEKLDIKDNSRHHQEHIETTLDVSHLGIYIVSDFFENKSPVQRQRAVNQVLQPFFDQGLHAVQMQTKTSAEVNG